MSYPLPPVVSSEHLDRWEKAPPRIFYLGFDGDISADTINGLLAPSSETTAPGYADGRFSQGARFESGNSLTYDLGDIVFPAMGSISFHIKPLGWSITDRDAFDLFALHSKNNPRDGIRFHRQANRPDNRPDTLDGPWTFEIRASGVIQQLRFSAADWLSVPRGRYARGAREHIEWHHLLLTWDACADRTRLFIDGILWGELRNIKMPDVIDTLTIGNSAGGGKGFLLDDFAIYKYPLSRETARQLARGQSAGWKPEQRQKARPELIVEYDRLGHVYYYRLFVGEEEMPAEGIEARVVDLSGRVFASARMDGKPQFGWVFGKQCVLNVPVGKYHVITRVGEFTVRKRMDKDTGETWADAAKLGMEDILLPPFSPVEITTDGLGCFGRNYKPGTNGVLLEKIISQGVSLLEKPLTINAVINGREVSLKDKDARKVSASGNTAASVTRSLSLLDGNVEQAVLHLKQTLEQDGLLIFEMNLVPRPDGRIIINKIYLDATMPANISTLLSYERTSRVRQERRDFAGFTFAGQEDRRAVGFVPRFTISNDEVGLSWLCDNADYWGWDADNAESVFAWEKSSMGTRIKINLINKAGFETGKTLDYKFALMALPVRPLTRDARKWRLCVVTDNPALGGTGWDGLLPQSNVGDFRNWTWCIGDSLVPDDIEKVKQSVAASRQAGIIAAPHWAYTYQGALLPEARMYMDSFKKHGGREWNLLMRGSIGSALRQDIVGTSKEKFWGCVSKMPVAQLGWMNYHASANSALLRDYAVWQQYRLMKEAGVEAFMYDVPDIYPDRLPAAHEIEGLGFSDRTGNLSLQWPFFAHREMMRRTRTLFVNLGIKPLMIAHYGVMNPPAYSYCDLVMNGENLMWVTGHGSSAKNSYLEGVGDMSFVRANMANSKWGFSTECMPRGNIKYSHQALGIALLHDMTLGVGDGITRDDLRIVWDAYDNFGIEGNDKFIGYYHSRPPVPETNKTGVLASAYVKSNSLLLILVNTTEKNFDGNLKIDFAATGIGSRAQWRAKDLYRERKLMLQDDVLSLTLEKDGGLAIVKIESW